MARSFTVTLVSGGMVEVAAALQDDVSAESLIEAIRVAAEFLPKRPSPEYTAFRDFVESGQKIHAIKELRNSYGLGLKEAKDMVEAIQGGSIRMPTATEYARKLVPSPGFATPNAA